MLLVADALAVVALAVWPGIGVVSRAAESGDASPPPPAVEAVTATVDVERTLLREDLERHDRLAVDRGRIAELLAELYAALDSALKRSDAQAPRAFEDARIGVESAERERADLVAEERKLLERIEERQRRIRLLEERLAALQNRVQEDAGPLAGRWDIVLLPLQQRGTLVLSQSGTLVSGTYQLDGGWSGSLQGTLVNRKVHLERIDSKLGRSAEFEGYLSGDGSRVRGTWRSYELAEQDPASGQWSAVRRAPSP